MKLTIFRMQIDEIPESAQMEKVCARARMDLPTDVPA